MVWWLHAKFEVAREKRREEKRKKKAEFQAESQKVGEEVADQVQKEARQQLMDSLPGDKSGVTTSVDDIVIPKMQEVEREEDGFEDEEMNDTLRQYELQKAIEENPAGSGIPLRTDGPRVPQNDGGYTPFLRSMRDRIRRRLR